MRRATLLALLAVVFLGHGQEAIAATSMTTNGITFEFNGDYTTGRFVDGEPWVVDPGSGVTVISMTPTAVAGHHGWQVNATTGAPQYLDDRLSVSHTEPATLPAVFVAGDSVVKVLSYDIGTPGCDGSTAYKTCLEQASVLTVVGSAPAANSFRPPYYGTTKTIFSADPANGFDIGRLPSVADVTGQVSIAAAEAVFGGVWLDHMQSSTSERYVHPGAAIMNVGGGGAADYGAELAISINVAMLRSMQSGTDAEKQTLVYRAVQFGIDTYFLLLGGKTWEANGGKYMGRKAPVLYAGFMLSHAGMLAIGTSHGGDKFQEDNIVYHSTAVGEALWGSPNCSAGKYADWINNTGNGKDCKDPAELVDGSRCQEGTWCTANGGPYIAQPSLATQRSAGQYALGNYQRMSAMYYGAAAVGRLLWLETEWNHAPYFEYVDRLGSAPWNYACGDHCNTYLVEMHRAYGGPGEAPALPGGAPVLVPMAPVISAP